MGFRMAQADMFVPLMPGARDLDRFSRHSREGARKKIEFAICRHGRA
jgi:hypothetical protein